MENTIVQPYPVCFFKPQPMTPQLAQLKYALYIDGFPLEEFAFILYEDIDPFKYFITSYGRVFTVYGQELFPHYYYDDNTIYMRIELSCTTFVKRRKFYIHRLVANAFIPKSDEDIALGRNYVNHKFNKDGRCNYSWNLEWCISEENNYHARNFCEPYDPYLFNFHFITDRRDKLSTNIKYGEDVSTSRISEFQARLICEGYTIKGYTPEQCAVYAHLNPYDKRDIKIIQSIINGYSWNNVSINYGIQKHERAKSNYKRIRTREDKREEYELMKQNIIYV